MDDLQTIQGMLDDIDETESDVSAWEADFVDFMLKLTDKQQVPNEHQIKKIRKIHERVMK